MTSGELSTMVDVLTADHSPPRLLLSTPGRIVFNRGHSGRNLQPLQVVPQGKWQPAWPGTSALKANYAPDRQATPGFQPRKFRG